MAHDHVRPLIHPYREAYPNIRTVDYWTGGDVSERYPQSRYASVIIRQHGLSGTYAAQNSCESQQSCWLRAPPRAVSNGELQACI
jgi:hypothetical protein